ncbi:hypothetical protein Pan265_17230 [Mucisphaera calidilacus]|uniref:Uncharacterized protein n=1 Tax=Mucisphaera calidilacus TaxID=2527982 RepID=A0A518BY09_9BACT|nr:hypothetical protein Pan265_17230 [Mucisphaera calidilacus]
MIATRKHRDVWATCREKNGISVRVPHILLLVQGHISFTRDTLVQDGRSMVAYISLITYSILLLSVGCSSFRGSNNFEVREEVMQPGSILIVNNSMGRFEIEYIDELTRKFTWPSSYERTIRLRPRPERFWGGIGLYTSGGGLHFPINDLRIVVLESHLNFKTLELAKKFIQDSSWYMEWSQDHQLGVLVGVGRDDHRVQVNFYIHQILVNGMPVQESILPRDGFQGAARFLRGGSIYPEEDIDYYLTMPYYDIDEYTK